jgi:uncharacterized protein YjdB
MRLFLFMAVLISVAGCGKDDFGFDPVVVPSVGEVVFGYDFEEFQNPAVRSVLGGQDIEDRITGITVAVYRDGSRVDAKHFAAGRKITFSLEDGVAYDIYAMANMGDMTSFLPASASGALVEGLLWNMPSYSQMASAGLPMTGSLKGFVVGKDETVIPLRRLLAKVTAKIQLGFPGATISGVTVRNLNGKVRPFGVSAATASSEVMAEIESETGGGAYGTFVFYVPENMQGVIGSAVESHGKNPDLDEDISARRDVLTYIEVTVAFDGSTGYTGEVQYRSYLGNNATKNFDIMGNCRYIWDLTYLEDNLQYDDWKVDTGSMGDGRILKFLYDDIFVESGQQVLYPEVIQTNLPWSGIAHTFQQEQQGMLAEVLEERLRMAEGLKAGSRVSWDIRPESNPSDLADHADIKVVKRYLDIAEENYSVDPGSSVAVEVLYGDSGRGRILGKGGTLWKYTADERFTLGYDAETDILDVKADVTARPGKYDLSVVSADGLVSDKCAVNVNDTRYITFRSGGSPDGTVSAEGTRLDVSVSMGAFTGENHWTIPFTFGDCTGVGHYYGVTVDDLSEYIEVTVDGEHLDLVSVEDGLITVRPHAGLLSGAYSVTVRFKEDGACQATACLNISGKAVTSIVPSSSDVVVYVGEKITLSAVVNPSDATIPQLRWTLVSGAEHASVDAASGEVTGLRSGSASVIAEATDGSGVRSSAVTVEVRQHVTSVKLDRNSLDIKLGENAVLRATVGPDDAYDKSVTWSSSDPSVAAVDQNGNISPKKVGYCVVTVRSNDVPSLFAQCSISVATAAVSSVTMSEAGAFYLMKAEQAQTKVLSATASLADGTSVSSGLSWSSSSPGIASVDQNGRVTAVSAGEATISASYTSGGVTRSAERKVYVSELTISPASSTVDVGYEASFTATLKDHGGSTRSVNSSAQWSSSSASVASSQGNGTFKGLSRGSSVVRASYSSGTAGEGYVEATLAVADHVTYELAVTPENMSLKVGESASLKATYYTLTNGVRDGGKDVTASAEWSRTNTSVCTVSEGRVSATAAGTSAVTARYGGCSDQSNVTVSDKVEYSLEVTPSSHSLDVGASKAFTVKYYVITNNVKNSGTDVTSSATWTSSNTGVASVSKGTVTGKAQGSATITASYSGLSATATVNVSNVVTYELTITPNPADVKVGKSVSLTATYVTYTNGSQTKSENVTASAAWSTGNASRATVSKGSVTGVSAGSVTITATYSGKSASATVNVSNNVGYELVISPSSQSVDVGKSVTYTATYYVLTNGVRDSGTNVTSSATWSSNNTTVASVSKGTVSGVKAGQATITASYQSQSASAGVTVKDVITYGVVLSSSSFTINYNETHSLKAYYVTYTNGVETGRSDVTSSATWSSSNTAAATVSGGTVTGKGGGTSTIKATYNGYSAQSTATVKDVYTYDLILSTGSTSVNVGASVSITATYRTYKNGSLVSSEDKTSSATWTVSEGSSYASVSAGKVTGKAKGTAKVTASFSGKSATATVTVNDVITYGLVVSPTSFTIDYGKTQSVKAYYVTYTNGSESARSDVTSSATWSSSNTGVATVSGGVVTGKNGGSATVTATYSGKSASSSATVKNVVTYALTLSPTSFTINYNETKALTAMYYTYTNGSQTASQNVTASASWSSSNTGVATVSAGSVRGINGGSATITASYNGCSATCSATVQNVITYSLSLSASSLTINYNETKALTATYYTYTNGSQTASQNVTASASWSSSNTGVATVSAGSVRGVSGGSATITVSHGGLSKTASVTVNDVYSYALTASASASSVSYGGSVSLSSVFKTTKNGSTSSQTVTSGTTFTITSGSSYGTLSGSTFRCTKGGGTVTIQASYVSNGTTYTSTVSITTVSVTTYKVVVTASSSSIYVGYSTTFTATRYPITDGVQGTGTDVTTSVTWSSGSTSIATVDSSGKVKGVSRGTTSITATLPSSYGGASGSANIQVNDHVLYHVETTAASSSIEVGETTQCRAYYVTTTNGVVTERKEVTSSATWTSRYTDIATVSSSGVVTGMSAGSVSVTARYNGYSEYVMITVSAKPDVYTYELKLSQSSVSLKVKMATKVTATYITYKNGVQTNSQDVTSSATWSSNNTGVSTVSAGVISGVSAGTASVTASYSGKSAMCTVTVTNDVTYKLVVSPSSLSINEGSTGSLTATYYTYTNGTQTASQNVTTSATWSSNNTGVATVSKGTVTGVAPGSATITASYSGLSDAASVTVNDAPEEKELESITFSPTSVVLAVGSTQSLSGITATYDDGSTSLLTSMGLSWKSSNSAVASVSSTGKITAVAQGSATITGSYTYKGVTCSATCLVTVVNKSSSTPSTYVTSASQWIDDTSMKFGMQVNYSNASSSKVNLTYEVTSSNNPSMPVGTTGTGTTSGVGFSITTYNVTIKMTTVNSYVDASGISKKFSVMITLPKK